VRRPNRGLDQSAEIVREWPDLTVYRPDLRERRINEGRISERTLYFHQAELVPRVHNQVNDVIIHMHACM
jgi:hypothetical protein